MTVSFKSRMIDNWYYLTYLATRTTTGRCLLVLSLIVPLVGPAAALYHTVPGSNAEHFTAEVFVPIALGTYIVISFSVFLGLLLGSWITPTTTIVIDPDFCSWKQLFERKFSWRSFSKITKENDYFYFMGWRSAYYIPKWAFDSRAEADAFYQMALGFWREAKGILPPPVPDTTGVWPPAPRPISPEEP